MATTTSATATVNAKPTQAARHRRENSSRPTVANTKRTLTGTGDDASNKRRKIEPEPLVRDNAYILSKFAGNAPSLIIHLYDDFWRLDGQESSFSYGQSSPMQVFLKHLREGTIPHDLLPDLHDIGTQFYDGCLIVQVKNHRSAGIKPEGTTERRGKDEDGNVRFSMHNWNEHITPSPYVPFPRKAQENSSSHKKGSSEDVKPNGSMPPPDSKDAKKDGKTGKDDGLDKKGKSGPKVTTTVLHPTTLSMHVEMLMLAATPLVDLPNAGPKKGKDGRASSVAQPPTPSLAAPPTPLSTSARKNGQKMCLEPGDFYNFEAERLVATAGPLYLEPVGSAKESDALIEALSHPLHSAKAPSPKTRKRTTAELAAEDAAAAETERRMLIMDERIKPAGLSSKGATGESGQQAAMGGLAFGRFKTIELVRAQHEEKEAKKKEEEARAAEAKKAQDEARANSTASQLSNGNGGMVAAAAAVSAGSVGNINNINQMPEAQRRILQQKMQQQRVAQLQAAAHQAQVQAQQEAQQRQQQLQAQIQAQQQAQSNPQNIVQPAQQPGHPPGSAGGMMAGQPNVSMIQQSPIVRNQTPNANLQSSPMIPQIGFPMTSSGSQQGMNSAGSPARPSSAVPMNPAMNMARNGSQQQNTPQMPHSTPQIPNRNMNNASAMGQRAMSGTPVNQQQLGMSSPAGMSTMNAGTPMTMATPHMSNPGLQMPPGSLTQEQIAILQQQQQQRQQHLAQQQTHSNSMGQGALSAGSPVNGMTPGQFSQARANGQQQQQYQAQVRLLMSQIMAQNPQVPQQLAIQRAQAIIKSRNLQQQAQMQQQGNMQHQGGNAGSPMGGGQGHPQQPGNGFGGAGQMGGGNGDQQTQQQAILQARQQQLMAQQRTMQQQQGMQQLQQIASQHGGQIPQQVAMNLPLGLQNLLRQQQQQQQLNRMRAANVAHGAQRQGGPAGMPPTNDREQYMAALRQQKMFLGQMNNQGNGGGMGMGGAGGLNMGGQSFNGQGNGGNGDLNQSFALMQAALQGGANGQRPGQGSGM